MKEIIFTIINFLILVGIVALFGRKIIVKIFRGRRERINRELDETEAILSGKDEVVADNTADAENDAAIAKILESASAAVAASEAATELAIKADKARNDAEYSSLRREMLTDTRQTLIGEMKIQLIDMFSHEPYLSMFAAHESELADAIIGQITLTPGDMAYLKTHDVLYVTLTSAYPLKPETSDRICARAKELLDKVGGKPSFWVKTDPALIGGLRLRIGDTVYDGTVENALYHMEKRLGRKPLDAHDGADEIKAGMLAAINGFSREIDIYQRGRAISVSDGICWLDGLADIMYGEVIEFACGERGMVLDIEPDKIGCVVFDNYENIESGSGVRRVGRIASVPVGDELLGRVLDPLGHPIDGKGKLWTQKSRPIECEAPGITDRKSVGVPMHTGIKAIDSMVPIGRGQRELIIGDRQTGKTAIAIDAILNQKDSDVICIYVAIGQKETTVAEIYDRLTRAGATKYTIVVAATASDSASLQYIAPFSATAMGEYFMRDGRDVLIVYDDLSKHAVAYRELSLLLHRPSGREAYPGDVFYLHARLLERSARLSDAAGGGSMTALPIIETQAGDISSYIPTNVISITDGQIFLEAGLFNEGQRPAINVGLSVSRVGSAAQTKLMKQGSSRLRMNLAQYRELAGFAQFGTELDESSRAILQSGKRMMSALRQNRYKPLSDARQAVLIYAVSGGYADGFADTEMDRFEEMLFEYLDLNCSVLMKKLSEGAKMDSGTESSLREALEGFAKYAEADRKNEVA